MELGRAELLTPAAPLHGSDTPYIGADYPSQNTTVYSGVTVGGHVLSSH